jgi:hypothetical protein
MTYVVTLSQRVEPDEFCPTGRMILRQKKASTLSAAKEIADRLIDKLTEAGTVVEVQERKGRIKYRVERDAHQEIRRDNLV